MLRHNVEDGREQKMNGKGDVGLFLSCSRCDWFAGKGSRKSSALFQSGLALDSATASNSLTSPGATLREVEVNAAMPKVRPWGIINLSNNEIVRSRLGRAKR
jgi:hypothetical protein